MVLLLKKLIKIMKKVFSLDFWTEKKILLVSAVPSIFITSLLLKEKQIKDYICSVDYSYNCTDLINILGFFSFIFFSFLLFSFIFLFQKNKQKFINWRKFSFYYSVFFFGVVFLTPKHLGDYIFIEKIMTATFFTLLHFLLSFYFLFKTSSNK